MSQDITTSIQRVETSETCQPLYPATRKQLFILGLFPFSEAIAWTTIFPYIYSMVGSFSSSSSPSSSDNTPIYAGLMVSVFTFGEFIMAPQWARISDKIGRKSTLLIGTLGAVFSAVLFGLSRSLAWAIVARTCAGLLNPNLGVVGTFVGELVPRSQQAGHQIPITVPPNTMWDKYPFLLPNLVVVIFLLGSGMIGFFFLDEVHPKFRAQIDIGRRLVRSFSNIFKGRAWNDQIIGYAAVESDGPSVELIQISSSELDDSESEQSKTSLPPAFSGQVMLQILSSAILGFMKIATLAIIPIFLATPLGSPQTRTPVATRNILSIEGGFGLDTTNTSNVLLSQAFATILSQILAIPAIISRMGALHSYRMILVLLCFTFVLMPFSVELPTWAGMPAILLALWIYALGNGLATTASAILITNTAPSTVHLAKINGASASLGCLARTLGPAVSGALYRWGLQIGFIGLPFWSLSAIMGVGLGVSFLLRDYP
ncbi:MFS multidrug transporter [Hyaloscypha finlandica]|nr:MFS multidrug transporter [Hyaloscypha finlandica]